MGKQTEQQKKLNSIFSFGATTLYACQYDQRFSYYMYIPKEYNAKTNKVYPLVVLIHGTERAAQQYRDEFIDFAEKSGSIILAPLFPAGIIEPDDLDSYKFIKYYDIRFDEILLSIIDEVSKKYRIYKDKFLMHGFSGGGQFAHRFLYLHPSRLLGASIGAPGRITYLDKTDKFYDGISDFEDVFAASIDFEAMRGVRVQMIVGNDDTEELGSTKHGSTRVERLESLKKNFESHGINVVFDKVKDAAHEGFKLIPDVEKFFLDVLKSFDD